MDTTCQSRNVKLAIVLKLEACGWGKVNELRVKQCDCEYKNGYPLIPPECVMTACNSHVA